MVNLAVREETSSLLKLVESFAAKRIRPDAADAELRMRPEEGLAQALREIGVSPAVAEEHGGQGELGRDDSFLVAEELAYGDPGIAYEALAPQHAARMIAALGDDAQRAAFLPRLAAGASAAVLYYEGFGRGAFELAARAVVEGGDWVLEGRKIGVVRPADTDLAVVLASAPDGPAAFVLDGSEVAELGVWRDDQERGKLGVKAARTGVVEFSGLHLPAERRLAGGPDAVARAVAEMRLSLGALLLGAARASLDYARDYAEQRVAFGQPIIGYQGVAFPLADVTIGIESNRLNALALLLDLPDLADGAAADRRATLALNRIATAALDATRIGVNSLGGHGFLMDHPAERWHRATATLAALDFDPLASDLDVI